jgi:hypothetical protein
MDKSKPNFYRSEAKDSCSVFHRFLYCCAFVSFQTFRKRCSLVTSIVKRKSHLIVFWNVNRHWKDLRRCRGRERKSMMMADPSKSLPFMETFWVCYYLLFCITFSHCFKDHYAISKRIALLKWCDFLNLDLSGRWRLFYHSQPKCCNLDSNPHRHLIYLFYAMDYCVFLGTVFSSPVAQLVSAWYL